MGHYHAKSLFLSDWMNYWHFAAIQFQSRLDNTWSTKVLFEQELDI
jgi:hypothetical protein